MHLYSKSQILFDQCRTTTQYALRDVVSDVQEVDEETVVHVRYVTRLLAGLVMMLSSVGTTDEINTQRLQDFGYELGHALEEITNAK